MSGTDFAGMMATAFAGVASTVLGMITAPLMLGIVGAMVGYRVLLEVLDFAQGEASGEGGHARAARNSQYAMLDDHLTEMNEHLEAIEDQLG